MLRIPLIAAAASFALLGALASQAAPLDRPQVLVSGVGEVVFKTNLPSQ